jgi:hypothetical protein
MAKSRRQWINRRKGIDNGTRSTATLLAGALENDEDATCVSALHYRGTRDVDLLLRMLETEHDNGIVR